MKRRHLRCLMVFSFLALCMGCAPAISMGGRNAGIRVPVMPQLSAAAGPDGAPLTMSRAALLQEVSERAGPATVVDAPSAAYLIPEHGDIALLIAWWEEFANRLGVEYHPEAFDCEDYARALATFGEIAAVHAGFDQTPILIGTAVFELEAEWQSIQAGAMHAVVLFESDRGTFITEPQTGQTIPLADFPARRLFALTLY